MATFPEISQMWMPYRLIVYARYGVRHIVHTMGVSTCHTIALHHTNDRIGIDLLTLVFGAYFQTSLYSMWISFRPSRLLQDTVRQWSGRNI